VEKVPMHERPDMVLVQGETNTVMAGGLAGVILHSISRIMHDFKSALMALGKEAREN